MKQTEALEWMAELEEDLLEEAEACLLEKEPVKILPRTRLRRHAAIVAIAASACLLLATALLIGIPGLQRGKTPPILPPEESSSGGITSATEHPAIGSSETSGNASGNYGGAESNLNLTFEELLPAVNDLAKAEYLDTVTEGTRYLHRFKVLSWLRSEGNETEISVEQDASVDADIPYQTGTAYLLLLKRSRSVFDDADRFASVTVHVLLPLREDGTLAAPEDCRLLDQPLSVCLSGEEIKAAFANQTVEAYLLEKIKDNPVKSGVPFTDSEDMKTVLAEAECVLEIETVSLVAEGADGKRVTYRCRVRQILKGEEVGSETVTVVLPSGISPSEHYIVAVREVDESGKTFFTISAKSGVYSLEQAEQIYALLNIQA